jgi:hypothetical protein
MKHDPYLQLTTPLSEALTRAAGYLRSYWTLLLVIWLATGLPALLLVHLSRLSTGPHGAEAQLFQLPLSLLAMLIEMLGFLLVVTLAAALARGDHPAAPGRLLRSSLPDFGRLLLTSILVFLRVMLWLLPVIFAFFFILSATGFYGSFAGQGDMAEGFVAAMLLLIFAIVIPAYVRYGWAPFFTLLYSLRPAEAVRWSVSFTRHNLGSAWLLWGFVRGPNFVVLLVSMQAGIRGQANSPLFGLLLSLWSIFAALAATHALAELRRSEPTE